MSDLERIRQTIDLVRTLVRESEFPDLDDALVSGEAAADLLSRDIAMFAPGGEKMAELEFERFLRQYLQRAMAALIWPNAALISAGVRNLYCHPGRQYHFLL